MAVGLVLALLAGAIGGAIGGRLTATTNGTTTSATNVRSVSYSGISASSVLAKMSGSVVSIQSSVQSQNGPWSQSGEADGTGIVIDSSGDILTNAHVVSGATSVTVSLHGSSEKRSATVVGSDTSADVAVLRVDDASGLTPATLATSSAIGVGAPVVAIGNALALEGSLTVTQGIISATDRSIQTDASSLTGLLQTDAAISSGNSGGPLVAADGTVVGMNTAVAASSSGVEASNVGFAIPIGQAMRVAAQLVGSR